MWSLRNLFVSSNFKNFFLGSSHGREIRDTRALYEKARRAWRRLPVADEGRRNKFLLDIVFEALERPDRFPGKPLLYAAADLVYDLFSLDGLSEPPEVQSFENLSFEEGVALRSQLYRITRFADDWSRLSQIWRDKVAITFQGILEYLPASAYGDDDTSNSGVDPLSVLSVPLIDLCEKAPEVVQRTIGTMYDDDIVGAKLFEPLRDRLERNLCSVSDIPYETRHETKRRAVLPPDYDAKSNTDLVDVYLAGTPFASFYKAPVPFSIPFPARFEHTHVIGGTGHGKTQLMQLLIYRDLLKSQADNRSVIVMDSQGDLLRTITKLAAFSPSADGSLADRLVIVDPTDVEYPLCLNLFDWNRERLKGYGLLEREKLLNSAIELYEYLFGALLGAELTQRQGVIFKYLARLMMEIPDATIQTLRELMENGEPFRPYMQRLPGSARSFFETRFFDRTFNETKKQILTRLWGVLSSATLERMFSHPRNKVDLFEAMNEGKIILINTAKDLLKQEGCAIFGRFFIALIVQAAMERSSIAPHERNPAFVYIDEAQDYFDENIGHLLNQARKYLIGMVLAHQNLDQLGVSLRSSIFASTSIKFAGGVSAKDARLLSDEMRCDDDLLLSTRKRQKQTEFACYIRNLTPQAVKITMPLGYVESVPMLDRDDYRALVDENRARYAVRADQFALPSPLPVERQPETKPEVRPAAPFLDALGKAFAFNPPREHGLDSQKSVKAMHDGRAKVFVSLGGNFLLALSDTAYTAEALSRTNLTVRIGTKLNRSDLVTGRQALILPCLGRTERDITPATSTRPAVEQFTSTENSMGVIQWSRGKFAPASPHLMGETAIVCRMAHAILGANTTVDWPAWADNYDLIRDGIARVIPGCHHYNERVREPGGFYLPNPPRENIYPTDTGKAKLTINPIPDHPLEPGQLVMTTIRGHDQFNTTQYGLHDRYRGMHHKRQVVMMNRDDIAELGLVPNQLVDVTSHFNGQTRVACAFTVVEYPLQRRSAATYFPEGNVLVPIGSTEPLSNCPTYKHTIITVRPAQTAPGTA